jgi:hypothetical protein
MSASFNDTINPAETIMNQISGLQGQEDKLFQKLNDPNLSQEEKEITVQNINEISTTRKSLYETLLGEYSSYKTNLDSSSTLLGKQMQAVGIVEVELNGMKEKLNMVQDQKVDKLRMIQINTYYGKQYAAHKQLMQTIVATCLILLILIYLVNKGWISYNLYRFLMIIFIVVAIYILGKKIIDLYNRSNMNFDEYNWYFNASQAPPILDEPPKPVPKPSSYCIDEICCGTGTSYDKNQGKCVTSQMTGGNNGSVTCNQYCGGSGGGPWNNELPVSWNGAKCLNTDKEDVSCDQTSQTAIKCNCTPTFTAWNA